VTHFLFVDEAVKIVESHRTRFWQASLSRTGIYGTSSSQCKQAELEALRDTLLARSAEELQSERSCSKEDIRACRDNTDIPVDERTASRPRSACSTARLRHHVTYCGAKHKPSSRSSVVSWISARASVQSIRDESSIRRLVDLVREQSFARTNSFLFERFFLLSRRYRPDGHGCRRFRESLEEEAAVICLFGQMYAYSRAN